MASGRPRPPLGRSGGPRRPLCLALALLGLRREGLPLLAEPPERVDPRHREVLSGAIRDAANRRRRAYAHTQHTPEDEPRQ